MSSFGLWEQSRQLWIDYIFNMGDFGYLELLKLAGIDSANRELALKDVREQFNGMVKLRENFDPIEMAEIIATDNKDVQFSTDFFDVVHPKKTVIEIFKLRIRKLLRRN